MTSASNNNGRAYEYICLTTLFEAIDKKRGNVKTLINSSYRAAKLAWDSLSCPQKDLYQQSAKSTISTIFAMEPNMTENSEDAVIMYIQPDQAGEIADVRDIIIERKDIVWTIGLSIKHNHMAVKHSRIAKDLDFGAKWYGVKCSKEYWNNVAPIFEYLNELKIKGEYFRNIPDKEERVYVPLLEAFMKEISLHSKSPLFAKKLVEYLLCKYDFYKVISDDSKRATIIQSFNIHGSLNRPGKVHAPSINVPKIDLPTSLLHIGFKPGSKTTIIMCLDKGWQFSFRIHNAKDTVETSLKFDIQIVGTPSELNIKYICNW